MAAARPRADVGAVTRMLAFRRNRPHIEMPQRYTLRPERIELPPTQPALHQPPHTAAIKNTPTVGPKSDSWGAYRKRLS